MIWFVDSGKYTRGSDVGGVNQSPTLWHSEMPWGLLDMPVWIQEGRSKVFCVCVDRFNSKAILIGEEVHINVQRHPVYLKAPNAVFSWASQGWLGAFLHFALLSLSFLLPLLLACCFPRGGGTTVWVSEYYIYSYCIYLSFSIGPCPYNHETHPPPLVCSMPHISAHPEYPVSVSNQVFLCVCGCF